VIQAVSGHGLDQGQKDHSAETHSQGFALGYSRCLPLGDTAKTAR
jgi:hypothetical protein